MNRTPRPALAAWLVALICTTSHVDAAEFPAFASNLDGAVGQIVLPQMTYGEVALFEPVGGLAISPSGELFGVRWTSTSHPFRLHHWLIRIDPDSQTYELRGELISPDVLTLRDVGLAFDAAGRLWFSTSAGSIFQVDPLTATLGNRIDLEPGTFVGALAGCGTTIYGLSETLDYSRQILRIDPDSGSVVVVATLDPTTFFGGSAGLDFGPEGTLWATMFLEWGIGTPIYTARVSEFDPRTGAVIQTKLTGGPADGLATAPPPLACLGQVQEVPVLGTHGALLLTVVLVAGGIGLLRRRRTAVIS